jgi:hypothetical protein
MTYLLQSSLDISAIILSLLGLIATLLGGFAVLGRAMLKFVLGPGLDGKGGAWRELTHTMEQTNAELVELKHQHTAETEVSQERHTEVLTALAKVIPPTKKGG